jgi:transposase
MKRGRFSKEQIIGVLKQHDAGRQVPDLAREMGVSEGTINTWKSKYGGLEVHEAQQLRSIGRGEPAAEAVGGRPQSGQRSSESGDPKKCIGPLQDCKS